MQTETSIRTTPEEDTTMKSREERNQMIHDATPEELLDWYNWNSQHFNPLNDESCWNFEQIKEEILRRMNK